MPTGPAAGKHVNLEEPEHQVRWPWHTVRHPAITRQVGAVEKARRKDQLDKGTMQVLHSDPWAYEWPQTDDLGPTLRRGDGDHFNVAGLHELGKRFADRIQVAFFADPVVTVGIDPATRAGAFYRTGPLQQSMKINLRIGANAGNHDSPSSVSFKAGEATAAAPGHAGEQLVLLPGPGYVLGGATCVDLAP